MDDPTITAGDTRSHDTAVTAVASGTNSEPGTCARDTTRERAGLGQTPTRGNVHPDATSRRAAGGSDSDGGTPRHGATSERAAVGHDTQDATSGSDATPPRGVLGQTSDRTPCGDTTRPSAVGADTQDVTEARDATPRCGVLGQTSDRTPDGDTKASFAVGADTPATREAATPLPVPSPGPHVREIDTADLVVTGRPVDLADPSLAAIAATVDDLEGIRKALANRLRILTTLEPDSDGVVRGHGLPENHPGVEAATDLMRVVRVAEDEAVKVLTRRMKAHPLGPWVKAYPGIGEKTIARFLGGIGDPAWHPVLRQPRTFGQLKAYVGLHVVDGSGPRRKKGQQVNWNGDARMRLWNCVIPSIKNRNSRLREVYDEARMDVADKVHTVDCAKCGHKAAGTPWNDAHKHGHAVRLMMVALLRDLWLEARRLHGWDDDPLDPDGGTQAPDHTISPAAVGPSTRDDTRACVTTIRCVVAGHTSEPLS